MRVRGHSRFLRRRGDFVDLHFNMHVLCLKFVSINEERREKIGKKRESRFLFRVLAPLEKGARRDKDFTFHRRA